MLVNSIPVYWGNPLVGKDFNTNSFINYHDYKNEDEVIDRIIELDNDDTKYLEMLKEPWYNDNKLPRCMNEENILDFFSKIFSSTGKLVPVARTSKKYLYQSGLFIKKVDHFLNEKLKYRKNFR